MTEPVSTHDLPRSDAGPAPDVSVLVPSFRYAHFIGDAIDSVLGQRGVTAEVIVQDADSDDGTVDVLRGYGDAIQWRCEPDDGQSDGINRAWARARGRWVGWLNADEFYFPDGLAAAVDAGDRTGADLVYGDTAFVDGDGRLTRLVPQHRFRHSILKSYGCFISCVSCFVRRDAVSATPIDPSMRRMMDWDLYLRMAAEGRTLRHVVQPVGVFRAHDTRVTATERRGFAQRLNREDGFGREYDMMRDRYGAFRVRRAGHIAHGVEKLAGGAYGRQRKARALQGTDIRWFASPEAADGCRRLVGAVYGSAR